MPHNTAPAARATGTPAPIEGAGAAHNGSGQASAAIAPPMQKPVTKVSNFIAILTSSLNLGQQQPIDLTVCNQS